MKLPNVFELKEKLLDWWFRIGGWRNRWLWTIVIILLIWRVWTKWGPITRILSEKYYQIERAVQLFFLGDWLRSGAFLHGVFVLNAILTLSWVFTVIFTYYDARERFDRGWFWAGIAFFFPFLGLLFYLFYRNSTLAEIDLLEMEYGYLDTKSWALQDMAERRALAQKARLEHFIKVRQSNLRERFPARMFSPKFWFQSLVKWIEEGDPAKQVEKRRQELANQLPNIKRVKKISPKTSIKQLRGKLLYYQRMAELANLPREDEEIDLLVSDNKLEQAIELIKERLLLAREMADGKGEATYVNYLERFVRAGLISEQTAQAIDAECVPKILEEAVVDTGSTDDKISATDSNLSDKTVAIILDSDNHNQPNYKG